MSQPSVVNDDGIEIPEIDRRQIAGGNLLCLDVVGASGGDVWIAGGIIEERIKLGIGVAAAVGAVGRETCRGEDIAVDVGLLIAADPSERVHLKGAAGYVGIEGGEFIAAQVEGDADFRQF